MRRNTKDGAIAIVVGFAVVLGLVIGIPAAFGFVGCKARWSGSGMPVAWGPLQGCQVQLPSGRWIPEDRLRATDLETK